MKFIELNGEDIALILAQPTDVTRPQITSSLPFTDVERAIGAREARRNFGRSSRYTFSYVPRLRNAGLATEFRIGLARLKDEPVAVPLWNDHVKLSVACSAGATSLQKTADLPVRSGAEWIILAQEPSGAGGWEDAVYEIVTVTSVGSSLVALAAPGTEFAWPVGTLMYPLLFGRLEERPTLDAYTPSKLKGQLVIREDSPFARKLNVTSVALPVVGSGVPAYAGYFLWDTVPLQTQILDTTEADIIYQQIGFLRQEQKYTYQQSNRRGLEMEFVCRSRAEIAKIERLFSICRGPVQAFFIPTFRADMVITQNLPRPEPDERLITIQASEFSNADRPVHPGDPYVAIIHPTTHGYAVVDARKLAGVLGNNLTCAVDITQTHLASNSWLSHLLLCCFASPEITWEYSTPQRARCRIKFIEKPDEYVTPQTAVTEPAYLYKFTKVMPTPQVQYFTSYEDSIEWGGHTWTPAPFSHGAIKSGIQLQKEECEITSWGGNFPGNPLAGLFPYTLEGRLSLDIIEVNAADPDDDYAKVLFSGNITKPEMTGKDWRVVARWFGNFFDRNIPRVYFQKTNNVSLYSPYSGVDKEDHAVACTFHGAPGTNTEVVLDGGADKSEDYFAAGFCTTGTGANFERRPILHSEVADGRLVITIDRRFRNALDGQAVICYPGTNSSLGQFIAITGSAEKFRAYPYIPIKDPGTSMGEVAAKAGGKKG